MKAIPHPPANRAARATAPWFAALALVLAAAGQAGAQSPFTISPVVQSSNGAPCLRVRFEIPDGHHLYRDKISFELAGEAAPLPFVLPEPVTVQDKYSGAQKRVFAKSFEAFHALGKPLAAPVTLAVRFQGCNDDACFFPETRTFRIDPAGAVTSVDPDSTDASEADAATDWRTLAAGFNVAARGTGYLNQRDFLAFLDGSKSPGATAVSDTASLLQRWGWLATLGFILVGGIGLNLTPCILPLIPVNLAIIGAGARNASRRRGFFLGGTYGVGMALAYGGLGLVVVLTGAKFGTLNSSPWFNLAIAAIFVVLGLAMFDVIAIDFSRFQGRSGTGSTAANRSKFALALGMGGVAALLAGACVAPVVISVLLLSTNLYSQGAWLGLLLPFLLGLGMALPWPFAGAGLSFLPRPGKWMTKVKYAFGVIIALFALYYAHLGLSLWQTRPASPVAARSSEDDKPSPADGDQMLATALTEAAKDHRPVVVDFWASWCKNCSAMEHTTFRDPAVCDRLKQYHVVRYQAEHPNQAPAKQVLDRFGVMGLPSYVVLTPGAAPTSLAAEPSEKTLQPQ